MTKLSLSEDQIAEHAELIDKLGGPAQVAKIILRRTGATMTSQNVGNMKKRGIPPKWCACLALEAGARGLGVPKNFLNEGEQPPQPKPTDAEVPFL